MQNKALHIVKCAFPSTKLTLKNYMWRLKLVIKKITKNNVKCHYYTQRISQLINEYEIEDLFNYNQTMLYMKR
jgi:hypothetical protein